MENEWETALQGFDAVWQRVQGGGVQPLPGVPDVTGSAALAQAICGEAAGERHYACAACMTGGRSADTLRAMAAECAGSLRRLQTEYFLETGDTLVPEAAPPPADGLPGCLRRAYLREGVRAGAYLKLSAAAESEARRMLYGDLSLLCSRRREKLCRLVEQMFG